MRIYIFDVGAIGGYIGGHLAGVPGLDVGVIARGPQLAAIRDRGLRVMTRERDRARFGQWQVLGPERAIGCDEIWTKIINSLCWNPVAVLTGATLGAIADRPEIVAIVRRL